LRVLFIGDIVGKSGRNVLRDRLIELKRDNEIDVCIANGENSAGGIGINCVIAQELYGYGVDIITTGNHVYSKKEVFNFIDSDRRILRPANYPEGAPGQGSVVICTEKGKLGIINLLGRVYMDLCDCPFKTADRELEEVKKQTRMVFVDFHAEATSEKAALAWYLDGRVSCVVGTHTHVQTADERILDRGTAFMSDAGMTGPSAGIIGVDREISIRRFITRIPVKYEIQHGIAQLNGVIIDIDETSGKSTRIQRLDIRNIE
jgi:2',3'-cyclic-nucleotide 2'-phosphodiesterase